MTSTASLSRQSFFVLTHAPTSRIFPLSGSDSMFHEDSRMHVSAVPNQLFENQRQQARCTWVVQTPDAWRWNEVEALSSLDQLRLIDRYKTAFPGKELFKTVAV